ncbi:hypothetical protein NBRC10512_005203 [Rhodotorula toruloides]|uniref:histidine kinase n=2 Tax=Rhodotorula toruloides TaxID=5286 RepID=A0A061APG3_RHOTO|nr:sensor histidine kinase/response regulator [Rhodotorula toruloides NP11]EMS23477.1 sensor histidine kinase/response regulator [Rhodotorula toruloides NP11]CDR37271.1 RHTO0S02e12816g1_1 [Rhodotorula toruloides]
MLATASPPPTASPSHYPRLPTTAAFASPAHDHSTERAAAGVIAAAMVEDALATLLKRYSDGTAALDVTKVPIDQPDELVFEDHIARDNGTGSTSDQQTVLGEEGSLEYAKELYRRKGHLPALKNPREEERRRVLRRYSLHSVGRVPAIDQLAKLARDVFQVDTVVINVVLEDRVLFVSTSGWDPKEEDEDFPRIAVDRDASFCPHAMSKPPNSGCFQVPDAVHDWRFKRSPLVNEGKGPVGFFASSNINLRPVPIPDAPEREAMPVGSLCLVHHESKPPLNEAEERMLKQFAMMAANQFELAFEKERHRLNDLRNEYTADLFRRLMVYPSRNLALASPSSLPCAMSGVCDKVRDHTGSDYCFVLDLRAFNFPSSTCAPATPDSLPLNSPPRTPRVSPGLTRRRRDPSVHGPGHISVMDVASRPCDSTPQERDELHQLLNSENGIAAVARALAEYHDSQRTSFALPVPSPDKTVTRLPTALSALLPSRTTATIAVPVFDHEGEPALFMVCGSTQPHFEFEPSDEHFVSSIGAILIAGQSQERILAADKAKTSFVGHISHELRTPLFALGSQLELIRTMVDPIALTTITPLLDVAETCLTSLREILDDTLDYTKLSLSNGQPSRKDTTLCELDLQSLIVDVVKSCASKAKDLARLRGMDDGRAHEQVPLMFRSAVGDGTRVKIDVGGFKRVLINLISNAMKFTDSGSITIAVSTSREVAKDAQHEFVFEVIDTGKGMDSTFMRDDLLTPFKQKDPFAPGAGLGTSIADNIVKRMGGSLRYRSTLGRGTAAMVTVPLEVVSGPVVRCDDPVTRNLTQELEHLFNPIRGISRPASPGPSTASRSASAPVPSSRPPDDSPQSRVRCLVVDDNAIARRVLVTYLKTKKIEHAEAGGGAEAIELFKSFKPNLVWCDIQMPDIDGIEASRAMREHEHANKLPPARIIAISGLDSTHANHADVVASGQVDEWFVKAGSSLRTLAGDLVKYDKALAEREQDKLANGVSHLVI